MAAVSESAAKAIVAERFLRDGEVDATSLFGTEYVSQKLNCRPDIIFTRPLHAVEIKTAADSLRRLPNQLKLLTAMFPLVSVACATKHVKGVRNIAPKEVGIYEIQSTNALRRIRRAKKSRAFLLEHAVTLLPSHELSRVYGSSTKSKVRTALEIEAIKAGEEAITDAISSYIERRINTPKNYTAKIDPKLSDNYVKTESSTSINWSDHISFGPVPNDIAKIYQSTD